MRLILLLALLFRVVPAGAYPVTVPLGGPESLYTPRLLKLLEHWPPPTIDFAKVDEGKVEIRCLETPGREFFIGLEQAMIVRSDISLVEAVLDDVDHYTAIFTEFSDIHVVSRDENRMTVFFEHRIPFPLIPNTKYEMLYVVDKSSPDRRIYRYKLKRATGDMNTADGIIVIERAGPGKTRYVEYDFWDGEYGILKTLAPKRIWKDSVEETYLTDAAIKVKAEHPDWKIEKVIDEAKRMLDPKDIETCVGNKKRFFLLD